MTKVQRQLRRVDAIELCEKISLEQQDKFTELGYKPFMFLVDIKELPADRVAQYQTDCETFEIDEYYFMVCPYWELVDTIAHEMVHMYIQKYHLDVTQGVDYHWHGKEFCDMYFKITGRNYDTPYDKHSV